MNNMGVGLDKMRLGLVWWEKKVSLTILSVFFVLGMLCMALSMVNSNEITILYLKATLGMSDDLGRSLWMLIGGLTSLLSALGFVSILQSAWQEWNN